MHIIWCRTIALAAKNALFVTGSNVRERSAAAIRYRYWPPREGGGSASSTPAGATRSLVSLIFGSFIFGEGGRRQPSLGLPLQELLQKWRDADRCRWGGGRLPCGGIARPAQPASVLRLVLEKQPADHITRALVHE
jgi:hypothetical protein